MKHAMSKHAQHVRECFFCHRKIRGNAYYRHYQACVIRKAMAGERGAQERSAYHEMARERHGWWAMSVRLRATLIDLRGPIAEMAKQIITPKDNTFTRMLAKIDAAIGDMAKLEEPMEVTT